MSVRLLHAQDSDTTQLASQDSLIRKGFYKNLDEGWRDESGRLVEIPFYQAQSSEIQLSRKLVIPWTDELPDTLFLYFEGLAWETELEVDGMFLGIHQDPFQEWVIPLKREWIKPAGVDLKLRMKGGEKSFLYPQSFVGVFRSIHLLDEQELQKGRTEVLPQRASADTVCVYAAWWPESGPIFDAEQASKDLLEIQHWGFNKLYFPFEPSWDLKALCAELGLVEVKDIRKGDHVGWYRSYPYEPSVFPFNEQFWLDEIGNPTRHYDCLYAYQQGRNKQQADGYSFFLTLLILFPLIGLLVFKLLDPAMFASMRAMIFQPKPMLESFNDNVYSNPGALFVLLALKVLMLSTFAALFIFFASQENQWDLLNLFSSHSLTSLVFYKAEPNLGALFFKSLLIIGLWALVKGFVMSMIGGLFRIHAFALNMLYLELMASFPLVLMIAVPTSFLFFAGSAWVNFVLSVQLLLFIVYIARSLYVLLQGMGRMFSFPVGVRLLYISIFQLLPTLIWL